MIYPADILQLVKTQEEANALQKQLDDLLSLLFTPVPFETVFRENIIYEKQEKLLTLLSKNHVNTNSPEQVQRFLQEMKKNIAQIPIVTLTIAFSPKQELLEMIATWFVVNTKKPALLNIIIDRNLIGGAIIEYKGLFKDYSLKKILQEKYEKGDILLQA